MILTDDSHSLNPASPSDSRPLRPDPSHAGSDGFKSLSGLMSTLTHDTPPPDGSPQIASSPDRSPSFSSWLQADSHSGSTSSWESGESWESWDSDSMTEESHPPSQGQTDHPPPAPPSETGLSTRPRPQAGAESSDEESMRNAAAILMAMSRQGFRPRTYGSGAVGTAKGKLH
jgi:hypothetical protein